jgi:hypothetical protein
MSIYASCLIVCVYILDNWDSYFGRSSSVNEVAQMKLWSRFFSLLFVLIEFSKTPKSSDNK